MCEREREREREREKVSKGFMFCTDLLLYLIYYIICP